MKIQLVDNLHRLWSIWLAALIPMLAAMGDALPQLQQLLPPYWYAWLSVLVIIARAIRQNPPAASPPAASQSGFISTPMLGLLGGVILCLAVWGYGQHQFQAGEQVARAAQAQQIAQTEQAARRQQQQHAQALADLETQYQQEKDHDKEKLESTLAAVRADNRRLYIAIRARDNALPASHASGDNPETRAELSAEAGAFLIRFAGEADDAVRDLNRCVDRLGIVDGR